MFPPAQSGAHAYAGVGVEAGGMGASPHKLIGLLCEGVRKAIGKAIRIVESGLQLALNVEAGGETAQRLNALYGYITKRLLEANIQQSESMLAEVDGLLATLEEAWLGIAPKVERMARASSASAPGSLTR